MITCSRCGKENQKHYKFCLGCGAKLEAPAAPAEPAASRQRRGGAHGAGRHRAGPGAAQHRRRLGAVPSGRRRLRPAAAARPRAAPPRRPRPAAPSGLPPAAGTSGAVAGMPRPAPVQRSARGASVPSGRRARAAWAPARARSGPVPGSPWTAWPRAGRSAPRDMIPCPKCGKPVVATYAFCGSCGQRMKGGGAGGRRAAGQRPHHAHGLQQPAARGRPRAAT